MANEELKNKVQANRIIIRHGGAKMQASYVYANELGYNTDDKILYIGQPSGDPLPVIVFRNALENGQDGHIKFGFINLSQNS